MAISDIIQPGAIGPDGDEAMPWQSLRDLEPDVPETDQEAETTGPDENWRFWQEQINTALIHERRFRKEGQNAERLYFGPDDDTPGVDSSDANRANQITDETGLIHSNIEVLKPLVFSETPTPIVQRRWRGDGKHDETDLMAAEAGQRIAQWLLSTTDFDTAMERARDDWLIPGRGAARVMYRADFGTTKSQDPLTGMTVEEEVKVHEAVVPKGTDWRRLLLAPSHGWEEMPWLAFEIPMTRARIDKRFPEHKDRFAYNNKGLRGRSRAFGDDDREERALSGQIDRSGEPVVNPFDTATIWEIWNKETRTVIWWSPDCKDYILDKQADPLGLESFFPMAKPLLATTRGDSMNPRPDIAYYAERAREIDQASRKMNELLKVLAVSGLFPGTMADEVAKLMSGKNQLIPVKSWISLMEKGGTANLIQWLPLDAIMKCLQALQQMREASKQAMFEASGVSDIMRAQGDPNETATAQQIKGRYAGLRLNVKQRKMAFFARDTLRIMIEIMLELFDADRLAEICALDIPLTEAERQQRLMEIEMAKQAFAQQMARYQQIQQAVEILKQQGQQVPQIPPPPEEPKFDRVPETSWEMVHDRLKADFSRKITIQIETDSTVLADEQADKEARIEFLGAFSTFVQQLAPLASTGQFDMKTVKELLLFGVRSFPKSRTLEGMISQLPEEPKGPPKEDTQVLVAKIKAETDAMLKKMDLADADKQRAFEMKMKGVDLVAQAAEKAGEAQKKEPPH